MPYKRISQLPERMKSNLPKHAQEIYLKTFTSAWKQYRGKEETANRVAWSAVKRVYRKSSSGRWKKI